MLKRILILGLVLAGCANDPSSEVCSTGIVCPSPLKCAAVQAVCITNPCGNGLVDPGEACDDGNIVDGDGCSHDCHKEGCGNGTVDPGEDCDPPGTSTSGGIPCSLDCKFEVCGNGKIDADNHEQCDDGSNNSDTPCPTPAYNATTPNTCSNCTTSCTIRTVIGPSCGNHVCDTADGETITNCSQDCAGCGNGAIDNGEQCDNGSGNTDTPCTTPSYNNPPNTCSTCTTSCTVATVLGPYCGDGTCGNGETFQTCPADCTGCGNGLLEGTEACDNGSDNTNTPCSTPSYHNPPNTCSTCTNSCTVNIVTGPYCGDGVCANGETKTSCPADCTGCGNGLLEGTEACDNGSDNTNTPCSTPAYHNPPNSCSTCTNSCTLDTVVGPYCGDGSCNNGETKGSCPADCNGCGNGLLEGTEACDNGSGNTNTPCSTPAYHNPPNTCSTCTNSCTVNIVTGPFCGDGTCNGTETKLNCPVDCNGCGNGIVEGTEACDNGSGNTNTACTVNYHNPPLTCVNCTTSCNANLVIGAYCGDGTCSASNGETKGTCPADCGGCGNGSIEGTEECDNGNANTNTACTVSTYNNPPDTCSTCTKSCTVDIQEGPYCGDGTCQNLSGETKANCPADCNGCGNGLLEGTEQCDDGAGNTATACTAPAYHNPPNTCSTCTLGCTINTVIGTYCGDNICQASSGEDKTTCPDDCGGCGNGILEGTEKCDDGALNTNTACTAAYKATYPPNTCANCTTTCTLNIVVGGWCGDNIKNGTETCDGADTQCPTSGQTGATCSASCVIDTTGCH